MSKKILGPPNPVLTPMGCFKRECGRSPEYSCSYCPAVLCAEHFEDHEIDHCDAGKSSKENKNRKNSRRFT